MGHGPQIHMPVPTRMRMRMPVRTSSAGHSTTAAIAPATHEARMQLTNALGVREAKSGLSIS